VAIKIIANRSKIIMQILLLVVSGCLVACETAPPVQEMSDARQAIAVAKEAGAADFAAFHLDAAEKYLASAEQNLNDHAYGQARRDAKQAKMKALDALKTSEEKSEPQ
jgi:phage terminase Nu1 subunit (DNA packaging protein)